MNELIKKLSAFGVVPVVVIEDARDAEALADALCDGGLPCAEVTFRTEAAAEAIVRMKKAHPEMILGAGTVLTTKQVDEAVLAGSEFIVSPGFDPEIVAYCQSKKIQILPGCVTPSEVAQAVKAGLSYLKFFPAEQFGGLSTIQALCAPYTNVVFMPTGGVSPQNLPDYLESSKIYACGGSWIAKADMIANGDYQTIKERAAEACKIVKKLRP